MAQNYISRGEVITLTSEGNYKSGEPYRINGFNGVALLTVEPGETLSFQLDGVFEFDLADVKIGELILMNTNDGDLHVAQPSWNEDIYKLFGRAVTASDTNGKFYCRLMQSE